MLDATADSLWTITTPFSVGGLPLGCRATVVRLKDGGVWIHSPVPFTPEQAAEIRELGPVRYLIAPNLFHHLYLEQAKVQFPDAKLYGPVGLPEKRRDLAWDGTLEDTPLPWDADIRTVCLRGLPGSREVVFYHPLSKTLIVADLFFNLTHFPHWRSRFLARLLGTRNGLAVSRLFKTMIKDKNAFATSVSPLLGQDIRRVVLSHGEPWTGPQETLRLALQTRGLSPQGGD